MRRSVAVLVAAGMSLGGVAVAHAGTIQSATLQITVHGALFNVQASGATGNSTATSATLGAGSAFATTRMTASVATQTAPAVLTLGHNGALTATPGGVSVTAPVTGQAGLYAQLVSATIAIVPIYAGGGTYTNDFLGGVSAFWGPWEVGQARVAGSGITRVSFPNAAGTGISTAAQTHLTATGSFNLTPGGAGTVTLVSIAHVSIPGISDTASPTYLTLTYAAPEPGTLLLLGAGAAGLALAGRRKKRSVRCAGRPRSEV